MAKLFQRDKSGDIRRIVQKLIKENRQFTPLKHLEFLYFYRMVKPQYVQGEMVEALVKKLSPKYRDTHDEDVEIDVYYDLWTQRTDPQKERLMFGQLCRIQVEVDEVSYDPVLDEDERVSYRLVEPDIKLALFSSELEKYGIPAELQPALRILMAKKMGRKGDEDA